MACKAKPADRVNRFFTRSLRGSRGKPRVAEGEGFEPSMRFRIHAFQACALGQTMRPLRRLRMVEVGGPVMNGREAMELALEEARTALEHGDVPVGAVLLGPDGSVLASDHNRREETGDATAHAEMLVISGASRAIGDWRLTDCTLVVTLEPCAMCAMAAVWARIGRIVYGAADLKAGAAWSLFNIPQDERLNHHIELEARVLEEECSAILQEFFESRRAGA